MANVQIKERIEKVVVFQEGEVVLKMTPEEAAAVSLVLIKTSGPPEGLRGLINDVIEALSESSDSPLFDIYDTSWTALYGSAGQGVHFKQSTRQNSFFLSLVKKFQKKP